MPYVCKFCKGKFCAMHRLPENHACQGLGAYREKVRSEGRIVAPETNDPVAPSVSRTARAGASMDAFWSRVEGKMTWVILGIILGVYVLEYVVIFSAPMLFERLFILTEDVLTQPWTLLTSIFSHDPFGLNHILFNAMALFFFGPTVERLIGTRRFTYLFLAAGIAGGLAEIFLMKILFGADVGALGASGALQGLMGTLVVLAPTLTVLIFFVVPAPLWAITAVYVVLDLVGVVTPRDGVANIAHLAGLAVGIAFGFRLKQQGLRVVRSPPPQMRRQW